METPSESDLFDASRLFVSLIIGFIARVVTATPLLGKLAAAADPTAILLAIAAAGYVGTDAIESFMTRIVPPAGTNPAATSTGITNVAALLDKYSFVDPAPAMWKGRSCNARTPNWSLAALGSATTTK